MYEYILTIEDPITKQRFFLGSPVPAIPDDTVSFISGKSASSLSFVVVSCHCKFQSCDEFPFLEV